MQPATSLTLFAHLCDRDDEDIDLVEASLLIAEVAYERVDVTRALGVLEDLGRGARRALAGLSEPAGRVERLLQFLYGELGFHGNPSNYYDPRNSFLCDVLERRTGIPISLAVVLGDVAQRAGVEARGVSFPGHFLMRSPVPGGAVVIDPFEGRLLGVAELRGVYARATGSPGDVPTKLLEPAKKRHVLLRMLNNLRGIYASSGENTRLCKVLERMQVLAPNDETRAEIEKLGGRTGVQAPLAPRALN